MNNSTSQAPESLLSAHGSLLAGIGLIALGACINIPMDALVKYFTDIYDVFLLLWARFFFHFILLGGLALSLHGQRAIHPLIPSMGDRPWMQLLRGICLACASLLFFVSLRHLPLADAIALIFVFPLIITALAPFVLGEKVGIHRWGAVAAGFLGVCIIIRPGFAGFSWNNLLPLFAGLALALYLLLNRKLSNSAPLVVSLAVIAAPGAILFTLGVPLVWQTPQPQHLWIFPLIGLLGAGGHFCYIQAYTKAPASVLAPFGYLEIPVAVLCGWVVFRDFPDIITWTGIAILASSGLYILHREHRADARGALTRRRPRGFSS